MVKKTTGNKMAKKNKNATKKESIGTIIGSEIGKEIGKEIEKEVCCEEKEKCKCTCNHTGGAFYCLGVIGAAIYYISTATGFWMGVLGFLKALVWPVFLVWGAMKFLGL